MRKKYNAFTLAEVLVTLMIIGVIASITIPSLKKVSDEKAYVSGLLKAQTTLIAATKTLKSTEGPIALWTSFSDDEKAAEDIVTLYKKIMPSIGVPGQKYEINALVSSISNSTDADKDKDEDEEKNNNDSEDQDNEDANEDIDVSTVGDATRTILTADGILYNVTGVKNCTSAEATSKDCFKFIVDVNGSKEPNMVGVDVYAFNVFKNGDVMPVQGDCPPKSGMGWGCSSRVIAEKDISW